MHDIDRPFMELESDSFEYANEAEGQGFEAFEVFDESEVEQLAAELLAVSNEMELDQFLGDLIKKAGQAVGKVVKSPIGKSLGGMLKNVAKKALPIAGGMLGDMVLPGIGGMIGSKLGSAAGAAFGLELEGLSTEDAQFEIGKQFIKLAGDATKKAVSNAAFKPAMSTARDALMSAAHKFAPGLLNEAAPTRAGGGGGGGAAASSGAQSGRWVRRGSKIVLYGV